MTQVFSSSRRLFIGHAGTALLGTGILARSAFAESVQQPFGNGARDLVVYPQKRALMRITSRPPHLETPFGIFDQGAITPNDAFFVRYHLANIPVSVDLSSYRLAVTGAVRHELSLSLNELKALGEHREIVAVNQCSGNSRGFFQPRVFGSQLGNGSMGNARWVGIPLRLVLNRAGLKAGAMQVTFDGLDRPVLPQTPDFIKSLEITHALEPDVLLAWAMNGADLPILNGYPLKLIVPGFFGTYWVKHLAHIEVLQQPFAGHDAFFMNTAYRVPDNSCVCVEPGTTPTKTRPIGRLRVRSFITSLTNGAVVPHDRTTLLRGIAFDGGSGIRRVELSQDNGRQWQEAQLGENLGRYSFREWHLPMSPHRRGPLRLLVRATSVSGESQPSTATWNPAGYARNVVESVDITVS